MDTIPKRAKGFKPRSNTIPLAFWKIPLLVIQGMNWRRETLRKVDKWRITYETQVKNNHGLTVAMRGRLAAGLGGPTRC